MLQSGGGETGAFVGFSNDVANQATNTETDYQSQYNSTNHISWEMRSHVDAAVRHHCCPNEHHPADFAVMLFHRHKDERG